MKTRQSVRFIEPVHCGGRTDAVLIFSLYKIEIKMFKSKEDRKVQLLLYVLIYQSIVTRNRTKQ